MNPIHSFPDTYKQMLREESPNLFRLYLNPYVVQTCLCLERYIQTTWRKEAQQYQSFLANGFDEALSGAIKLARYCASLAKLPTTGLVIDGADRLGPFASATVGGTGKVVFLPGLVVVGKNTDFSALMNPDQTFGFIVLASGLDTHAEAIRKVVQRDKPLVISCLDRENLAALRQNLSGIAGELAPDIVVFDESFVNHEVPFSAFSARQELYQHWNRPNKSTFHSTTYQPNTVSTLHFMKCLEHADPTFFTSVAHDLQQIHHDLDLRGALLKRLYSPSLYKAICATGFKTDDVRAAGDFVHVDGRPVFDAVGGVACSVRGHNPTSYARELAELPSLQECRAEVASRLRDLTGLECVLPAVSGATGIENALKIALVSQYPRRHVLALKSGFGGKTLFALTGTWNNSYKEHIDPLYSEVLYVDPFAPDAIAQIDLALQKVPVAVVQVELIQGVGGVRRVPPAVILHLQKRREDAGYLLLVDEVQTGMYRTGPFSQARGMGLTPDLLVMGKAASDMMFPFAVLMYSSAVQAKLQQAGSDLEAVIAKRYGYEYGYKTLLNVLRRAEELHLSKQIEESGKLFKQLLTEELASCKVVREVRVYGLLLGIELDATRWPQRWFRKRLFWFYLYSMLRHPRYAVLIGFCQYEPNVLKITPPLTVAPAEIRAMCATIADVLKRPFYRLLSSVLGSMIPSLGKGKRKHEQHHNVAAHEPGQN